MSFLCSFFNLVEGTGEQAVCCPFPHKTEGGIEYLEHRASAHCNTDTGMFHCKACGTGHTELSFIQTVLGCDFNTARRLIGLFSNDQDVYQWDKEVISISQPALEAACTFGISEQVVQQLKMRNTPDNAGLVFPVFVYQHLVDVRVYRPNGSPKVRSRTGAISGLVLPFDLWQESNKVTILCAGEKDMAVTRSHNLNAITLTGGEQALCKMPEVFRGRKVAICYDNDNAGRTGAQKLAAQLLPYAAEVKVVTGFHEVCKETGEDLTDFFTKYQKTKEDLVNYIRNTPAYTAADAEKIVETVEEVHYPTVSLLEASTAQYVNKTIQSNIQVVAVSDESFIAPQILYAEKLEEGGGSLSKGDVRQWEISKRPEGLLHLIDNNFTEERIAQNQRTLLGILKSEKDVRISEIGTVPVYKAHVTDLLEADSETMLTEYTVYSIGIRLESGKKYKVTYRLVPHPYKGQLLFMIVMQAEQASDSVSNFQVTDKVKELLSEVRNITGSVADKVNALTQKVKGLVGYNGNDTLIQAIDLSYHTVLSFNFGSFKGERGYLDTLVVGESRVGKSSTASTLRNTYELGTFTSLAGNSATIPGLIGGSNKVNGNYQTRAGVIPQNHRGLIIFEEFGKSNNNIVKELTDIRSSNEVRIARVSGTITLPAMVRMITLTNVKNSDGQIRPIASYPHGIAVIIDLIGTAEDIARYDLLVVLSDKGTAQIDPLWEAPTPLDKEVYKARVRWVWSRTAEQVVFVEDTARYIVEQANELNRLYECHIKIFGTEAWKKLSRLAIAVAAYTVSTDDTFENILVNKEHVDFAVEFFQTIYDNPTFKLKEYVAEERTYSTTDEHAVKLLQELYNGPSFYVIDALKLHSQISKNMLAAITGRTQDELSKLLTQLTRHKFIRFNSSDIIPTERFRLTVPHVQRGHVELTTQEGVTVQHA